MDFLKSNFPNLIGKGHDRVFKEAMKFDDRQRMIPDGIKAKSETKYKAEVLFKYAAEIEDSVYKENIKKESLREKIMISEAGAPKITVNMYNSNHSSIF